VKRIRAKIRKRINMPKSPWENKEFARKNIAHIDKKFLRGTEQEAEFLIGELGIGKRASILDLGCGTGRHAIALAKHGSKVVGIDISKILIEEARRRAADAAVEVEFIVGDLGDLDSVLSKERKIDAAICLCDSGFGVLGGEEQDLQFLKAVFSLIAPQGKFILTTFNGMRRYVRYDEKNSAFDYLRGVVTWCGPSEEFGEELTEEIRVYTPSEARILFKLAGFRNIEIFGCSPGNFNRQELKVDDIEMMVVGEK
jgi:2-polyprenyl-3-methyl-5-hydroxy-6-metoxy-1,4-benzoquinol methylase